MSWPSRLSGVYEPAKRVMLKVKHERDCDCVVAGFRWHKKGDRKAVGSLLLGLFDNSGALQHVGVCASFTQEKRLELVEYLAPYRKDALKDHPWRGWAEHGSAQAKSRSGCQAARAAGAKARIYPGNRCAPNLCWKSLTSTCRARVSVTWRSFEGGVPTKSPVTAPMPSSKWFPPQELMEIFGR